MSSEQSLELQNAVILAQTGNQEGKEKVIDQLKPLVYKMMLYMPKDRRDPEDLFQESAVIILECIQKYDIKRNVPFIAYVQKQLWYWYKNQVYRYQYQISLDEEIEPGSTYYDLLENRGGEEDIEEAVLQEERRSLIGQALESLTPKQRLTVVFYYYKEEKMKRVAERLKCSYGTAVKHKRAALKKLKKNLRKSLFNF